MGGSTVAAIVVLTICLVGGLGLVIYMKSRRLACFQEPTNEANGAYEEVARSDGEAGVVKETPILKE